MSQAIVSGSEIASQVSQSNGDQVAASASGGSSAGTHSDLTQNQTISQSNANEQDLFSTSVAVAGHVTVSNEGDNKASENGIRALSKCYRLNLYHVISQPEQWCAIRWINVCS